MFVRILVLLFLIIFATGTVHSMRTPLSKLPTRQKQLKSPSKNVKMLEAMKEKEQLQKFEKNRIFFLIDQWMELHQKMG